MTSIGFLDTETTGLHPWRHEIWEVGLIVPKFESGAYTHWNELHWMLPVDLSEADPVALEIGGFHRRHPQGYDFVPVEGQPYACADEWEFAQQFASITRGMHLVCAIPSFDIPRLDDLLRKKGALPEWHYHVICAESMLVGKYGIKPPWKSEDLLKACGIPMKEEDKHTALGDARWVRDVWLHCQEGRDE